MAPTKPTSDQQGSRQKVPPKKVIEAIREATGANEEDVKAVLAECNYDVNEATNRLIDSELWFSP